VKKRRQGDEMQLGLVFVFAFSFVLLPCGLAASAEEATFALLKSKAEKYPEVGLNGSVTVRLNSAAAVPDAVKLFVDGQDLKTTAQDVQDRGISPDGKHRELTIRLGRSAENKAAWAALLAYPFKNGPVQTKRIDLEISGHRLTYAGNPGNPDSDEEGEAKIDLVYYHKWDFIIALGLVAIVIVATFLLAAKTTIVRDGLIPQLRPKDRSYSLGRTQMAFWLCIILSGFLFIMVMTGDLDTITSESLALLGITGATALGGILIDQGKAAPLDAKQKTITAMGLTSREDVEALYRLSDLAPDGTLAKAKPTIGNAQLGTNTDPTVKELRDAYEAAISDIKSCGFRSDVLSDVSGQTIYRWQILVWTVTLGIIYVIRVNSDLQVPTLGTNLLLLMGISGSVYLGFKLPEQQSDAPKPGT
jgi:hypothetical protein